MKRLPLIAVVVATLGLPSAVLAAHYGGPAAGGQNNAGVEFKVHLRNGDPRRILHFEYHNIPVPPPCSSSFGEAQVSWPVKQGKFDAAQKIDDRKVNVHGTFKHHAHKIVGTVRVRGPWPGCSFGDTGSVGYVAKKAG